MKASTELLVRINDSFNSIGSSDEPLDDLSRNIVLQVADAQVNSRHIRVSDIISHKNHVTAPTVYSRLKKLADRDLIRSTSDPKDRRAVLLSLTPKAQKELKRVARDIRQACQA